MAPQFLLLLAVATVGVLHTIVPDHWLPIALIARQEGWTQRETARAAAGRSWRRWARFPGLEVVRARQSYERLAEWRYRYTSVTSGFTAVVETDENGLPVEYAGVWRRVADGPGAPRVTG